MSKDPINSMGPQVLIVDDVPANLKMLCDALEPEGYSILGASDGRAALRIAAGATPDIILLDIILPGMDGYEVCRRLKQNEATQHIPVIFITAKDEKESLIEGFRVGGVDYITKPFEKEEVLIRVQTHLKISHLTQELREQNHKLQLEIARREQAEKAQQQAVDALQKADEQLDLISEREASRWGIGGFVGKSKNIQSILEEVRQLQSAGTTSVLITGESGTGKELIARAIHFGGTRAKGPFIPVNCSAIPSELAESTFFGHVRGAFTGANTSRQGYFEIADGGTLFLDEIGDMPVGLQAKLLRVLEDGTVTPIGGTHQKHLDVRILAATNADLQKKIADGTFRRDLYFRLARFTVNVPPLRERPEDIPLLAEHFLNMFAAEMGVGKWKNGRTGRMEEQEAIFQSSTLPAFQLPSLSPEALEALMTHDFPGNIRELKNIIEHALIKSGGGVIQPEHLPWIGVNEFSTAHTTASKIPTSLTFDGKPPSLPELINECERALILDALSRTKDQKAAAAQLGIPESTLRHKMDHHHIQRKRFEPIRQKLE